MKSITVLVRLMPIVMGFPTPPGHKNSSESSGIGLSSECSHVHGNGAEDTALIRRQCQHVFENEYIMWSQKMLADDSFVNGLLEYDISDHQLPREKRELHSSGCPKFTEDYLKGKSHDKHRSISPWDYIVNVDNRRIPRRIIDTRCRCSGCINLRTAEEDTTNFASVRLPITIPVLINGKSTAIQIHIGCTCVIPRSNL